MNLEDSVIEKLRTLSPDKKQRVLDFVETLAQENGKLRPRRSAKGLLADLNIDISEEDSAEARREMWGNFPRDDI